MNTKNSPDDQIIGGIVSYDLWQEPFIAQLAQLQPQEDLPFLLSLTKPTIIKVTISASTRHIIMVTIFCEIHEIIISVPFTWDYYFLIFTFCESFVASVYFLKKSI